MGRNDYRHIVKAKLALKQFFIRMEKLTSTTSVPQQKVSVISSRLTFRTILHRILDCARTAPFGVTIAGMGLLNTALYSHSQDYSAIATHLIGFSCGIFIIQKQYQLRARLENICQKRGYSDRAFQLTTKEWCDRQTARIAAEKHGHLSEYIALCDRYKEKSHFTNIRHF
jgi:hypothetical protein